MSKIVLYPANGCDFDAADVAAYLAGLTSGVFSGDEDFPVTAAGGLKVTVGAGRGWVHPSRFTGYSITKREADTLTMPLADQSRPRIDRIVLRYDAGARAASLHVLQGTASSTPTAPAISRTELIYDLCLAEITRPAAAASITTGQITDTRLDEALCGIVRDSVTGIPTDELLAAARERIGALEEKATTSAAAAKDSAEAAKSSETKSAASEKNAKTSETAAQRILTDTQNAVKTVTDDMNAAAESASTATTKAGEASTSAGAASASRQAAEKAQKAAENAAALAGTRAGTDKALRTQKTLLRTQQRSERLLQALSRPTISPFPLPAGKPLLTQQPRMRAGPTSATRPSAAAPQRWSPVQRSASRAWSWPRKLALDRFAALVRGSAGSMPKKSPLHQSACGFF